MPDDYKKADKFINNYSVELPKFYFSKMDIDKAKSYAQTYAKTKLCQISLSFKEQVTRRNVSPQITITPIGIPSYENCVTDLRENLQSEFAGDEDLTKLGMDSAKVIFNAALPKAKTDISQSIHFVAWVGARYEIETVHGEYNYFRDFVSPVSSEPLGKTILLVEKGEKIRVQEVREGEGGTMVDSDL